MTNGNPPHCTPMSIAVLAGGESAERDVSLESGAAVTEALAELGHDVTPIDPRETDPETVDWSRFDVAFIALHGPFGEDGRVQRILETAGIPFTGSDSQTSQLAFSKSAAKERFALCEVPTLPYVLIHETDDAARTQQQAERIGFPCVVKPDAQGSSLGVGIVKTPEQLPHALANCFSYDSFGILETYVEGTEYTVALMDDTVLPAIRIETDRPFFDYEAKYRDDSTRYDFEFALPANVIAAVTAAGRRACEALGTRGPVRADLMLDRRHRPWVLEVNTVPGLTSHSLLPKAAARNGISFGELCASAIRSALSHVLLADRIAAR